MAELLENDSGLSFYAWKSTVKDLPMLQRLDDILAYLSQKYAKYDVIYINLEINESIKMRRELDAQREYRERNGVKENPLPNGTRIRDIPVYVDSYSNIAMWSYICYVVDGVLYRRLF